MHAESPLPRLPRAGKLYLTLLLTCVVAFYALLVASLGLSAYLFVRLVLATPGFIAHQGSLGAVKLLLLLYGILLVYAYAVLRALSVKTGGSPGGIKLTRVRHPAVFALTHEVAARVQADPIDQVFLVPGDEIGVWEETALYLPPGTGTRKIVLGMAALSYLTLDELRGILAHEYAHFSHRDTFFARVIYRVSHSYSVLFNALREHGGWTRYLNPLYWVLRAFIALYPRLAARFSRLQEYRADQQAVVCYGRELYARALTTTHLEGSFFDHCAMNGAFRIAQRDGALPNVYHFVAASRREYDHDNPAGAAAALSTLLAASSRRLDSHPSLCERLDRQGVPAAARHPYPLPRPIRIAALDHLIASGATDSDTTGEPSAAEELLGAEVATLQAQLSDVYCAPFAFLAHVIKQAEGAGTTKNNVAQAS